MADGYVQIAPDGSGKLVDNTTFTRGGEDIYRQRVEIYAADELPIPVGTTAPSNGDRALIVRPMPGTEVHALNQEFFIQLHGSIHGQHTHIWHVLGSRSKGWSSTATLGDAAEYLDTSQPRINDVVVGTTYYLRSSSASDTAGGTGMRTVRIYYLDSAGAHQKATFTLNGTTPVAMGNDYSYVLWAEAASVGSNTVAVGNISISTNAAGAPAVSEIVEWIEVGGNRSLSGRIKVPNDHTGYLIDWHCRAISNTMDVRIRGDFFSDDREASPGVFHFIDRSFLSAGASDGRDLHYAIVPAGAEVKVSAIPGGAQAGNKIDCDFDLIIVQNVA